MVRPTPANITEGEEVLEPTMSFASNHQWSLRTGEYLGNYVTVHGEIHHISKDSFLMWLNKKDPALTANDVFGPRGLVFEYEGKRHRMYRE